MLTQPIKLINNPCTIPTHILNKALTHIGKLPNNSYPDKLTQMIILITNSSKEKNRNKEGEEKAPRRKTKSYVENG